MLRLSNHARQRMSDRNVSLQDAQFVHQNAHTTYDDPDGNSCFVGDIDDRRIKLIIAADDPDFVITVIDQTEETDAD